MQRRQMLKLAGMSAVATMAAAQPAANLPVLDTHIHLYDPLRPGGIPWPEKSDGVLYKPALPKRYMGEAARFGVVGAIAVECSPLRSDNQWLLQVATSHAEIVGVIGDLDPCEANFRADLERLHADPLFLGFRYGNLWGRDLAVDLAKPGFVEGLQALAAAGLTFESANPDARLIAALRRVVDAVPDLRVVVDHLPHAKAPTEDAARAGWWADLRALAASPHVYIKLSEIPVRNNRKLVTAPAAYKPALDELCNVFGEDRVMFGSDWPNSEHVASYAETFAMVRGYMAEKTAVAQEKYFFHNSVAAYKWKPRRGDQRAL
jgi:L-fuconolactonase